MPKHEDWSFDENKKKKHKKLKRKCGSSDEDTAILHKKSKHRTVSPDASPDRFSSKYKYHRKDNRKSPDRSRTKDVKKERITEETEQRFHSHDRHRHRKDFHIKKEEEFDRRQEELRERRREGNRANDRRRDADRPNNFRVKQERGEQGRQESTSSRDYNDERRRRERQKRDRDGTTEEAFKDDGKKDEKEKPNLGLSGALTEDTNTFRGVVIKYNEPPEARKPKKRWRLYPFKGTESLKTLYLHRQSAFLLGRQRRIADIPIDHPSCSKQHAVLQFRMVEVEVDGELRRRVKPYVLDLGSANGTYVNNERIDPQRYIELKEQDVLKFGFSSREYVLLHDKSDTGNVELESEEEEEG